MDRSRARAKAIARRRQAPLPWLPWVILLLLTLACASLAQAQTTPPAIGAPRSIPEKVAPPDRGVAIAPPTRQGGVIRPPMQVDPGMRVRTPSPSKFPTPTIKPRTNRVSPG